jgi:hypothetical protein
VVVVALALFLVVPVAAVSFLAPFGSIGDGSVFFLLGFFYSARRHGWEAFLRSSSPSLSGLPSVR